VMATGSLDGAHAAPRVSSASERDN
jgi:hypothetical protein